MCDYANAFDGALVPELHVTDLMKFRGPTAATSSMEGVNEAMLRISVECLCDEYSALDPPVVLFVDCAYDVLHKRKSPVHRTGEIRTRWRSDPSTARLDSFLSTIEEAGRTVPFWGQGNQVRFIRKFSAELGDYRRGLPRSSPD